jgi:hypothetical protein
MPLTLTFVFLVATCFSHIWAIIRQTFVTAETTALYTLSSVLLGTSLSCCLFLLYTFSILLVFEIYF